MKTLIIAEKPDMGRNIAAAIEPKAKNMRTYIEGEQYIITWAIGHLVGLAEPDAYDDRYKKWNISHLPIIPTQFKLIANKRTADQLKVIKELAARASSLVNACDAGREGQYIFSLIQRYLGLKQPVQRLWISDLTAETIRKGFAELRAGEEFANLTKAASARSEADWLIGMNGTRAFTTKHNELLSVGRVQTPVLALIYDREAEIEKFDSLKYYVVEATFKQSKTTYKGLWQGDRLTDQEKAASIAEQVKGKQGEIELYEVKETKEYPHRLYDLTLLQREANSRLNFSAKKTLDIAQSLYEKHKVITYPRTNSNYVNEQNIAEMQKSLHMLKTTAYGQWANGANPSFVHKGNKNVCNPAKVEDHHAILPTAKKPGSLSADEQKLYDLIVRRFLSQYYPPAQYLNHTVITKVEQHSFKTSIKQLLDLGWKVIYEEISSKESSKKTKKNNETEEDIVEQTEGFELDNTLPVQCKQAAAKEKETKPPKSFTEGTLLKAMESAGKQIEDDEAREAMKDCGLGTPATRAATIERLKQVGYITMQGKRITITNKGKIAIELIRGAGVELLTSPEMTGMWEKRLNEIARGQASQEQFMENVKKFATMIVDRVRLQASAPKTYFEQQNVKATTTKKAAKTTSTSKTKTANAANTSKAIAVKVSTSTKAATTSIPKLVSITKCPRQSCGGDIIKGRKGYGCSHFKSGCSFVIWEDQQGYKLTSDDIKSIIHNHMTDIVEFQQEGHVVKGKFELVNANTGELRFQLM